MIIKFWGTRGSIPTPEPSMIKYGGDTSCVEVRIGDRIFLFDIGTGARKLGAQLMKDPTFGGKIHLFLSHTHWDHIQGFPFFQPVYSPRTEVLVHGAFRADLRLDECLEGQMSNLYFPVRMKELPSRLKFVEMIEESIQIEDVLVTAKALNHPQGCFGYRIEDGKHAVVYATDTEPYPDRPNENLLALSQGADLLIHDAQYTPEEYVRSKKGWGHSTWKDAIGIANEAGVKTLVLFHHDPYHDDDTIDQILQDTRQFFPNTIAASRELAVELSVEGTGSSSKEFSTAITPPRERPVKITYNLKSDTIVFMVPEDLSLFSSKRFSESLCSTLTPDHKRVILSMARLKHIDSAGVGALATIFEFTSKRSVPMALCNVSRDIQRVLEVTRFDKILSIYRNEDEAMAGSFGQDPQPGVKMG